MGACHFGREEVVVGVIAEVFSQGTLNIDDGFNDLWSKVLFALENEEVNCLSVRTALGAGELIGWIQISAWRKSSHTRIGNNGGGGELSG